MAIVAPVFPIVLSVIAPVVAVVDAVLDVSDAGRACRQREHNGERENREEEFRDLAAGNGGEGFGHVVMFDVLVLDAAPAALRRRAHSRGIFYFFRYLIVVVPMVPLKAKGARSWA